MIGHGPHVLRAIERWNNALILYSMGNLINYGPFGMAPPMNRGAIVCVTLDSAGQATDAVLRPTRQPMAGMVMPDSTNRARVIVDSLSLAGLSRDGCPHLTRRAGRFSDRAQRPRQATAARSARAGAYVRETQLGYHQRRVHTEIGHYPAHGPPRLDAAHHSGE